MEKENKIIYRRDTEPIIWYVPLDLTTKKVYFTVKASASDSDDSRIMDKANALGGGSDSVLLVEYENGTGRITWYPTESDTVAMSGVKYYDITYTDSDNTNFKYAIPLSILTIKENIRQIDDDWATTPANADRYPTNVDLVGTKNGVNLIFTMGMRILENSERIYHGGSALTRDVHYSIVIGDSDTTVTIITGTYQSAPASGDVLTFDAVRA